MRALDAEPGCGARMRSPDAEPGCRAIMKAINNTL